MDEIFGENHDEKTDAVDFEETYYFTIAKLNKHIRLYNMSTAAPNISFGNPDLNASRAGGNAPLAEVRLPKITVPAFSGDYTEWTSFFDLYTKAIHETTLTPAQKFQYL